MFTFSSSAWIKNIISFSIDDKIDNRLFNCNLFTNSVTLMVGTRIYMCWKI